MSKYGVIYGPYFPVLRLNLNLNRGIPEMRTLIDNIANKIFELLNTAIVIDYELLVSTLRAAPFKPDKPSNANLQQVQLQWTPDI